MSDLIRVVSTNKDDLYKTVATMFSITQLSLSNPKSPFEVTESYTNVDDDHFITVLESPTVLIRAESIAGIHTYEWKRK